MFGSPTLLVAICHLQMYPCSNGEQLLVNVLFSNPTKAVLLGFVKMSSLRLSCALFVSCLANCPSSSLFRRLVVAVVSLFFKHTAVVHRGS